MRTVPGRDGRPLETVEEGELFGMAFPGRGEEMRRAARGIPPVDPASSLGWEAAVELVIEQAEGR